MAILAGFIDEYHTAQGSYPLTDDQSTWYEKLVESRSVAGMPTDMGIYYRLSSGGRLPLDYYGHPFVYEPPSPANGYQVVIRAVGMNGIDDHGALDDWDIRYGPNVGYWYKTNWRSAAIRAWVCGFLALLGIAYILRKVKQYAAKLVFSMLLVGTLGGFILPFGYDSGLMRGYDSLGPEWTTLVSHIGITLLLLCVPLTMLHVIYSTWRRRSLRKPDTLLCAKCGYDLRGTLAAGNEQCPECGEPVPRGIDPDIDLTPPV